MAIYVYQIFSGHSLKQNSNFWKYLAGGVLVEQVRVLGLARATELLDLFGTFKHSNIQQSKPAWEIEQTFKQSNPALTLNRHEGWGPAIAQGRLLGYLNNWISGYQYNTIHSKNKNILTIWMFECRRTCWISRSFVLSILSPSVGAEASRRRTSCHGGTWEVRTFKNKLVGTFSKVGI